MIEYIMDERFLIPFLSTLGASLSIIIGQQIFSFSVRQRKKLYCINYISDVADRLLFANLIVKKHTILPHIKATQKIIKGDSQLLDIMFKADEFDILSGQSIEFNHLPEEYKLLVGYDSMKTLQAIEFIRALTMDNSSKVNLNEFVKDYLKSELKFNSKLESEKLDILNTYWDYLDQVDRHIDRVNGFIINMLIPTIDSYKRKFGFKFFPTKEISRNLKKMRATQKEYNDLIPSIEKIKSNFGSGIQKVL